jgi:hypothetical protein
MPSLLSLALAVTVAVQSVKVLALPQVKLIQLNNGNDCSGWPNHMLSKAASLTGPLALVFDSSDNATVEGMELDSVQSWKGTYSNGTAVSGSDFVATGVENKNAKRPSFICYNGNLRWSSFADHRHIGIMPKEFRATITDYHGQMVPAIYAHEIDGVRQDGVYLGWFNEATAWDIEHFTPQHDDVEREFYKPAMTYGPSISGDEPTGLSRSGGGFQTFIKVVPLK